MNSLGEHILKTLLNDPQRCFRRPMPTAGDARDHLNALIVLRHEHILKPVLEPLCLCGMSGRNGGQFRMLSVHERETSPEKIQNVEIIWDGWSCGRCVFSATTKVDFITGDVIAQFLEWRHQQAPRPAPSTLRNERSTLNHFFRYARRKRSIVEPPETPSKSVKPNGCLDLCHLSSTSRSNRPGAKANATQAT
jgi:hypothetical protein